MYEPFTSEMILGSESSFDSMTCCTFDFLFLLNIITSVILLLDFTLLNPKEEN